MNLAASLASVPNPNHCELETIRSYCEGELPLTARLETWMTDLLTSAELPLLVAKYDSPLNIICSEPMLANANELRDAAKRRNIDLKIFFARKANKCLEFVEQAIAQGIGIDTASENELLQTLACGATSKQIICTAAVKSESLIDRCIQHGIVIVVDNADELTVIVDRAGELARHAIVAIRLGGFRHQGQKLPTRFGFDAERDVDLVESLKLLPIEVAGIHFHLDGYDAMQRVTAIAESIRWFDRLVAVGHQPTFLDIGGGIPMSYLKHGDQWMAFWQQLSLALTGKRSSITFRNHGLGMMCLDDQLYGTANSYPYFQSHVRSPWLGSILDANLNGSTVAEALSQRQIELRCEPGRSLMDGCGLTLARVEFRKQNADGDWLIGLSMNRTQCRTTNDDFLVDPILVPATRLDSVTDRTPMSGYLVGAYCTEAELISLRKLNFPNGVQRGDIVVFPNTAGYLMHFLESRSHQFPLAKNLVWTTGSPANLTLDRIDS